MPHDNDELPDHDDKPNQGSDNVIHIPRSKKRWYPLTRTARPSHNREPLVNAPPVTKFLVASFIICHILRLLILSQQQDYWLLRHFAFFPGMYNGTLPWDIYGITAPLTYMWLHGGWIHLSLNGVMLLAFGAGVERWLGGQRFLILFLLCGLCGAFAHFFINPSSVIPVIGASGGISGLFAAILIMLKIGGESRQSLMPFIMIWIAISVIFGLMGGPGGSSIAWAAHIGGFLGGFLILRPMLKHHTG